MSQFFDTYFQYVDKTECPYIFHRWSTITMIGALLGRKVWLPFGDFRIFPNIYCMLIGDPGTRKSTAIKTARKLASASGYTTFAAERTTKEKFLLDLEGADDEDSDSLPGQNVMENIFGGNVQSDPKEVFIVADEFNDFLGNGGLEFLSLLGSLWDWDDENNPYKQRLKNSKSVAIFQPTVSLLGGNTHDGFAQAFPPEALGQGFMSRLLLVYSESSGVKITFPEPPSKSVRDTLIRFIEKLAREFHGPITISARARSMLDVIYRGNCGITDTRFRHYITRRFPHLLKLCIICAAADFKKEIGVEEVLLANTILSYTEHFMPKALGEFGKARNSDVANKVITFLTSQLTPAPFINIWSEVKNDLDRMEELQKMLHGMQAANQIQWVKGTHAGWLIVRRVLGNDKLYVDYSLLKEYRPLLRRAS